MTDFAITAATITAAALMAIAPASAKDDLDPASYPQLAPEALLPPILAELRHTLPDVTSVREMRICPARRVRLKDGKPSDWGVEMEFNTRNQAGGYTGIKRYIASFRNGRIAYGISENGFAGREGLNGVFNRMIDKQMVVCMPMSDAAIQKALQVPAQ